MESSSLRVMVIVRPFHSRLAVVYMIVCGLGFKKKSEENTRFPPTIIRLFYFSKVITTFSVFPTASLPTEILKYPPSSTFFVGSSDVPIILENVPDVEVI